MRTQEEIKRETVYIGRQYVEHDPQTLFGLLSQEIIDWLVANGLEAKRYPEYQQDWSWGQYWDQGEVAGAAIWIRDPTIRLMFKLAYGGK